MKYSIKFKQGTQLKQSTRQAVDLATAETHPIKVGSEFPIAAWADEQKHWRVTFGKIDGQQIDFPGPGGKHYNTWLVWSGHAEILKNGQPIQVPKPAKTPAQFDLLMTPIGRDPWNCCTFNLQWRKNGQPVDQLTILSGAPGGQIVHPEDDYSGSGNPIPEGIYHLGPVERGWWGSAIGSIWISNEVKADYKANNRSAIGMHQDANRNIPGWQGSAGCPATYDEAGIERIALWRNSVNAPEHLIVDYGFGFLKSRGYHPK